MVQNDDLCIMSRAQIPNYDYNVLPETELDSGNNAYVLDFGAVKQLFSSNPDCFYPDSIPIVAQNCEYIGDSGTQLAVALYNIYENTDESLIIKIRRLETRNYNFCLCVKDIDQNDICSNTFSHVSDSEEAAGFYGDLSCTYDLEVTDGDHTRSESGFSLIDLGNIKE